MSQSIGKTNNNGTLNDGSFYSIQDINVLLKNVEGGGNKDDIKFKLINATFVNENTNQNTFYSINPFFYFKNGEFMIGGPIYIYDSETIQLIIGENGLKYSLIGFFEDIDDSVYPHVDGNASMVDSELEITGDFTLYAVGTIQS